MQYEESSHEQADRDSSYGDGEVSDDDLNVDIPGVPPDEPAEVPDFARVEEFEDEEEKKGDP